MNSAPPTKHHFIPAFFLRRWENVATGKLTQFSNPYKRKISIKSVSAESTGFEYGLYEIKDFRPNNAQQVEENFFKPLDTFACQSLEMLETHGHNAPWDTKTRSAWSRFILSLLLRCPEDIAIFRQWWREEFSVTDAEAEARYLASYKPGDPKTFSEYLAAQPLAVKERSQFEIFIDLIDNGNIGLILNQFHWHVLQTPSHVPTLLTSDRPVIFTHLGDEDAHIVLPIGPRLIWIAARDPGFFVRLRSNSPLEVVKEVNRQVVEGAKRYVWGIDEKQLRFIENRFGRSPQPRILETITRINKTK